MSSKEQVFLAANEQAPELIRLADSIFDRPEVGMEEQFAASSLCDYLESQGFSVERGIGALPTAFRAVFESGKGGPAIGFLCEYDALPGIGHACGHHMQGPYSLGAAVALKNELTGKYPFKLVVYGCPDEECTVCGGKPVMIENGCFRDIDVALMMHAGPQTTCDRTTLALANMEVHFKGRSAGPTTPDDGRSAFDALLLASHGIEFLREHIEEGAMLHYTFLSAGGTPANVVPDKSSGAFMLRSRTISYLQELKRRFGMIVEGAALMTGTTYEVIPKAEYLPKVPSVPLMDRFYENARLIGAPNIQEPRKRYGSGDFGNVMQLVPGIGMRVAFVPEGTASHSQMWVDMGKSQSAHESIVTGSKLMAGLAYDLITEDGLLEAVKADYLIEREKIENS